MKKSRNLVLMLVFSVILSLTAGAIDVHIDDAKAAFNESSDYPFISSEGRTLVPLGCGDPHRAGDEKGSYGCLHDR